MLFKVWKVSRGPKQKEAPKIGQNSQPIAEQTKWTCKIPGLKSKLFHTELQNFCWKFCTDLLKIMLSLLDSNHSIYNLRTGSWTILSRLLYWWTGSWGILSRLELWKILWRHNCYKVLEHWALCGISITTGLIKVKFLLTSRAVQVLTPLLSGRSSKGPPFHDSPLISVSKGMGMWATICRAQASSICFWRPCPNYDITMKLQSNQNSNQKQKTTIYRWVCDVFLGGLWA